MIDQIKIGAFLRELRKEKGLTQETLAEKFGVSSRSVSRWENGNTIPDLSILIELADYYAVDVREIIDGERKSETMEKEAKETLLKVADYADLEKKVEKYAVATAKIPVLEEKLHGFDRRISNIEKESFFFFFYFDGC